MSSSDNNERAGASNQNLTLDQALDILGPDYVETLHQRAVERRLIPPAEILPSSADRGNGERPLGPPPSTSAEIPPSSVDPGNGDRPLGPPPSTSDPVKNGDACDRPLGPPPSTSAEIPPTSVDPGNGDRPLGPPPSTSAEIPPSNSVIPSESKAATPSPSFASNPGPSDSYRSVPGLKSQRGPGSFGSQNVSSEALPSASRSSFPQLRPAAFSGSSSSNNARFGNPRVTNNPRGFGFGNSNNAGGFGSSNNAGGPRPSYSRGGSNNAGGFGNSNNAGGPRPSYSRGGSNNAGGFGNSNNAGGPRPSYSRGGSNNGFGNSNNAGGPRPSFSRGESNNGFGNSNNAGGPRPSFSHGESNNAGGFENSNNGGPSFTRGGGGFGNSNNAGGNPRELSYVRVPLQYTLADRNAHIPDSDNGRYMAVPVSLGASGSQIFGSPTDNAKIWKIEMHSLYVLLIDTDQIKQRLLWPTFEECLQHLMAHEYMSISSFTPFHQTVGRMPGWTAFLKDVQSLCLDGTMTVTFVKRIFSRLPKTLKKFAFLPHQSTVDMPAEDALNRVPKAVQHLTFDTTCFPQGDLVTAVGLLPFKSENKYERLVLFGRRFPSGPVLQAFFDRLEEISLPGASVTLFTSNTPNDAIIGPLLDRGFVRGNRHLRPYGAHYDMYKLRCNLKFRIGFLVPKIDPQQEEDDDDDWP